MENKEAVWKDGVKKWIRNRVRFFCVLLYLYGKRLKPRVQKPFGRCMGKAVEKGRFLNQSYVDRKQAHILNKNP